jgi:hypothetical protein
MSFHLGLTSGTTKSCHFIDSVKRRTRRAYAIIDKYNDGVANLPKTGRTLTPLNKKNFSTMTKEDEFWELELMETKERWADNAVRRGIFAHYTNERASEEIKIVGKEAQLYSQWVISRLDDVERVLSAIKVNSPIGYRIFQSGLKAAGALRVLRWSLSRVKLPDCFSEVQQQMKGIRPYILD